MRIRVLLGTIFLASLATAAWAGPSENLALPPSPACLQLLTLELRDFVAAGQYSNFRGIQDYRATFGARFIRQLAALSRNGRWIDMGAGHGRALKELALEEQSLWRKILHGKPALVGVAYERPKSTMHSIQLDKVVGEPKNLKMLYGRFVEDIPDEELGHADLITDVYGPLSYSDRVDQVLAKDLRLLNEGGTLYVELQAAATKVVTREGETISFERWISRIDGLTVEVNGGTLAITKNRPDVSVPGLSLVSGKADAPPERVFAETPLNQ